MGFVLIVLLFLSFVAVLTDRMNYDTSNIEEYIKNKVVVKESFMAKYICRNCGNIQYSSSRGGCAPVFWNICLVITIFISIFVPVAWVVVGFEILFLILTTNSCKQNICMSCNSSNCVVPLNTPAGEKIYEEFNTNEEDDEG